MENTLTVFVAALQEQWEMPDALALKWEQYETENPLAPNGADADERHMGWFNTLTAEEQAQINRHKVEA